jgi:dihydrodipicolinate synthase/N-acetylneuraminate lyase
VATKDPIFTGVAVALATLFDERLDVDVRATCDQARRLVEAGVRAVAVCGTTGEPETLDRSEKLQLLDAVLDAVGSDVPVIMGITEPSGRQASDLAAVIAERAVAGVMARSPRGVEDPTGYYQRISQAIDRTPLLAYHFPAVAPPGIPVATLPELPVVGLKDSSGDPERLLSTVESFTGDVYVGAATLLVMAGALGCAGAILQLANACPEECIAAFEGDAGAQRTLLGPHLHSRSSFPGGIKSLMNERFGTSQAFRLT